MPVVDTGDLESEIYPSFSEDWPRTLAYGKIPEEPQCKALRKSRTSVAILACLTYRGVTICTAIRSRYNARRGCERRLYPKSL